MAADTEGNLPTILPQNNPAKINEAVMRSTPGSDQGPHSDSEKSFDYYESSSVDFHRSENSPESRGTYFDDLHEISEYGKHKRRVRITNRGTNWSEHDKMLAVTLVLTREAELYPSKLSGGRLSSHRKVAWLQVTAKFNEKADEPRTSEQLKKAFENIRMAARRFLDDPSFQSRSPSQHIQLVINHLQNQPQELARVYLHPGVTSSHMDSVTSSSHDGFDLDKSLDTTKHGEDIGSETSSSGYDYSRKTPTSLHTNNKRMPDSEDNARAAKLIKSEPGTTTKNSGLKTQPEQVTCVPTLSQIKFKHPSVSTHVENGNSDGQHILTRILNCDVGDIDLISRDYNYTFNSPASNIGTISNIEINKRRTDVNGGGMCALDKRKKKGVSSQNSPNYLVLWERKRLRAEVEKLQLEAGLIRQRMLEEQESFRSRREQERQLTELKAEMLREKAEFYRRGAYECVCKRSNNTDE